MTHEPLLTGVIGAPIAQSRSPLIHNFWRRRHGVAGVYGPYRVTPDDLPAFLSLAPSLGFRGWNVTAPLKTDIAPMLSRLTPRAARVGAVNTVTVDDSGETSGDLTDGFGFLASLAEATETRHWEGATVVLLGAGGAARAVVDVLAETEVGLIRIANRTRERAEAVATLAPGRAEVWDWPPSEALYDGADLIVNATSVGLGGAAGSAEWSLPSLPATVIATDLIYAPLETPFLRAAAAAGAFCVDGLGMLLHQARPGFESWHGVAPEVTPELRSLALGGVGSLG